MSTKTGQERGTGYSKDVIANTPLEAAKLFWESGSLYDFEDTIIAVKNNDDENAETLYFYPVRDEW